MRPIAPLVCLACLALAALSLAADKPDHHVGANRAFDTREGGEDIATAIAVTLPFWDIGATCDNVDDYDEACPYSGSTSPDVVYTFTADQDEYVSVDLCLSSYDTKVYVYDADLNLVACNDDYYTGEPCGSYVSYIDMLEIHAGQTYYLVVDGYGGDCGEYIITAGCPQPPCISVTCQDNAFLENEPPFGDDYVDTFNGGCDAEIPVFQQLFLPAGEEALEFCGITGWYNSGGVEQRDTDWLQLEAAGDLIRVEAESALFMNTSCDVMYINDCQDISVLPFQMGICYDGVLDIPTTPGETVYLRVQPTSPTRSICANVSNVYTLTITGIDGIIATESASWSAVRKLYR